MLTNEQNNVWEVANVTLRQIAEDKIGTVKTTKSKPWISDATWDRNALKTQLSTDGCLWPDYREAAKLVKKSARNDKRKFMDSLASDAEVAAGTNNIGQL